MTIWCYCLTIWCYCFKSPEPTSPWVFPDDSHADICGYAPEHRPQT